MTEWHDRAVDAALRELHGPKPPDLSARVLAALSPAPAGPLPRLARARRRLLPLLAGSALVGFAASLLGSLLLTPPAAPPPAVAVGLEVARGVVACVESGAARDVGAGSSAVPPFAAAPGNRLRTRAPAAFTLEPFGRLETEALTELEVRSMEFTKTHGVVAASSLTLGVVAGAVTWHALTGRETANAGELLRMQAAPAADPATLAELQRVREQLAALQQQHEQLLASTAQRDAAPPVQEAPADLQPLVAEVPQPAGAAMAFVDPRFAEGLAKVDWAKMGAATHEMGPVLAQLAEAMSKEGEEIPIDLAVKVNQLNGDILAQVPALLESGVPGFGPNGTFTHPLVVANTLASTLAAAGRELTPAQQQQIDGLVRAFSAEAESIAGDQSGSALERLHAETQMKDRFYREVGSLLGADQHAAVFPEGARAYEGASLFDTGVLLRVHAVPVPAKDATEFARVVGNKLAEDLGLDDATTAQVRAVLAQAANAPELWRDPANAKERQPGHFLRSGRTSTALRHQLEWMRMLEQRVALTPEQRRKLAKMAAVMVPLPR